MKAALLLSSVAWAAVCAGQQGHAVFRDGKAWVQVSSGVLPLSGAKTLRVVTRGAISVQGEARTDVAYTLNKRAHIWDAGKGKAALERVTLRATHHRGVMTLEVEVPADGSARAGIQLRIPRRLHSTEVESQGESIDASDLDGELTVRTGGGQVRLGKVGGKLQCFSGGGPIIADAIGEAGLNTEGGEIVVRLAKGPVRAATHGGSIRVERAERGLTATAYAGLIEVLSANGPVVAETGAGAIKVKWAADVQCKAGNGPILLSGVHGGLRAVTRSGSIVADLGGKPLENSWLSTGGGDITVFIPSNVAVTVQAISALPGSHRIVSDFPEIRTRISQEKAEAQGALNGGGPLLRLNASGGTIYLRRQR